MDILNDDYLNSIDNEGFLVPKLEVEMPLYRYRGTPEHFIDEIANDHIFLSSLDKLNDPFDSSYSMLFEEACHEKNPIMLYYLGAYFLCHTEWYDELSTHIEEMIAHQPELQYVTLEKFSRIVSDFVRDKGGNIKPSTICKLYYEHSCISPVQRRPLGKVASFSETWESIPMWAYYANSHTGVCIKYDFNQLDNSITYQNVKKYLQKVWYSNYRFNDPHGQFTPLVKSLQWAHEQEWRLFIETSKNYLYIPCITEIFLGVNFDWNNIDRLINELKKKDREIKLFHIHVKPNQYEFERVRINY